MNQYLTTLLLTKIEEELKWRCSVFYYIFFWLLYFVGLYALHRKEVPTHTTSCIVSVAFFGFFNDRFTFDFFSQKPFSSYNRPHAKILEMATVEHPARVAQDGRVAVYSVVGAGGIARYAVACWARR